MGNPGRQLALLLALAGVVFGSGCGGRKPVKVEGVVTLEGKPVEGASVVFNPTDTSQATTASAMTEADGSFRLYTQNLGDGALPGAYKVTVQLLPKMQREPPQQGDIAAMMKMMKLTSEERTKKFQRLPEVYATVQSTPLQITVPVPEGKVSLELKGKMVAKSLGQR
jgi:hypothetical protein